MERHHEAVVDILGELFVIQLCSVRARDRQLVNLRLVMYI